jgi:hypothetical protein
MGDKFLSIGSMHNCQTFPETGTYPDGRPFYAIFTDGPMGTTHPPALPEDMMRLGDFSDGSMTELVIGDGTDPKFRFRWDTVSNCLVGELYDMATSTWKEKIRWDSALD